MGDGRGEQADLAAGAHLDHHQVGLGLARAIFAETGLSYLGLGISPPDTSLGSLVGTGQAAATTRPWLYYFPGLFLALIVLSVNLVGDGLRDALDPRQEGEPARPRSRARPGNWDGRRKVNQELGARHIRPVSNTSGELGLP